MIAERAMLEQQRKEGLEEEKQLGARRLLEHQLWLREAKVVEKLRREKETAHATRVYHEGRQNFYNAKRQVLTK
jgi:hypothetical protein